MSAQGMSLALHDVDVFARAVVHQVENRGSSLLDSHSDTCLDHTWRQQAAAVWMTKALRDSGDPSYEGELRKRQLAARTDASITVGWQMGRAALHRTRRTRRPGRGEIGRAHV